VQEDNVLSSTKILTRNSEVLAAWNWAFSKKRRIIAYNKCR